jgi:hypothetical protein
VIQWLGEVIPPQAKVAKEQQSHLARQIAADRFNLQYAEASTSWYQSGELKFAGLRIRLTHAQARLGVPGNLIGGLAADAIEGLEVPAYVPPPEACRERPQWCSEESPESPTNDEFPEIPDIETLPTYPPDPVPYCEITEGVIATREAAGDPLPFKVIKYLYENGYLPTATSQRKTAADSNPKSKIQNLNASASDSDSPPPPPGDCATVACVESKAADETHHAPAETPMPVSTCDDTAVTPIAHPQPLNTPSQPLLTPRDTLPVTELELAPTKPGATVSATKSSPYPPLPTSNSLAAEP